jgi:hypothetical protein
MAFESQNNDVFFYSSNALKISRNTFELNCHDSPVSSSSPQKMTDSIAFHQNTHQNEPMNENLALKRHLIFNLSNWAESTAHWKKKLCPLRQNELTLLHNNVFQLYQEWPILKNHFGKICKICNKNN